MHGAQQNLHRAMFSCETENCSERVDKVRFVSCTRSGYLLTRSSRVVDHARAHQMLPTQEQKCEETKYTDHITAHRSMLYTLGSAVQYTV